MPETSTRVYGMDRIGWSVVVVEGEKTMCGQSNFGGSCFFVLQPWWLNAKNKSNVAEKNMKEKYKVYERI
jgi:hypothetical protein